MDISTAYSILGLKAGASEEDVKTAYRGLAQKYDPDLYEAGPLHDDAAARMEEVIKAFDTVMTALRTGGAASADASNAYSGQGSQGYQSGQSGAGQSAYADIRAMINAGNADGALQRLNSVAAGQSDGEWNFLVGSAYYYKGWVNDALRYFSAACRLAPGNREYEAALRNLQGSAQGNMYASPYAGQGAPQGRGMGCSCCDVCMAMMCMDMCCSCGC